MKTTLLSTPFGDDGVNSGVEEYRNSVTKVLSNLIQKEKMEYGVIVKSSSAEIDFASPKISSSTSLETLAAALDFELSEKEWFVTGNINPCYFSDNFQFQDPDVKVVGIEEYSKGVKKIFDQTMSRAEIISTVISETSTPKNPVITCTWRLSGRVNIGPGLDIKPYIVSTDFEVDPQSSLIVSQEDRFDIPAWDILLSAIFPFLIGTVTKAPAPPVERRTLIMPEIKLVGQSAPTPRFDFIGMIQAFFPNND